MACEHLLGRLGSIELTNQNRVQQVKLMEAAIKEFTESHKAIPHPGFILWFNFCSKCGAPLREGRVL